MLGVIYHIEWSSLEGGEGGVRRYTNHPIIVVFGCYIVPYYVILVMRYMHMYLFLSLGEKNDSTIFRGYVVSEGKGGSRAFC